MPDVPKLYNDLVSWAKNYMKPDDTLDGKLIYNYSGQIDRLMIEKQRGIFGSYQAGPTKDDGNFSQWVLLPGIFNYVLTTEKKDIDNYTTAEDYETKIGYKPPQRTGETWTPYNSSEETLPNKAVAVQRKDGGVYVYDIVYERKQVKKNGNLISDPSGYLENEAFDRGLYTYSHKGEVFQVLGPSLDHRYSSMNTILYHSYFKYDSLVETFMDVRILGNPVKDEARNITTGLKLSIDAVTIRNTKSDGSIEIFKLEDVPNVGGYTAY